MKNHGDTIYVLNSFGTDVEVKVDLLEYANGGTAIVLKSYETEFDYWEDYSIASVFIEGHSEYLEKKKVFIKDYSENEGVLNFLQQNGIVGPVIDTLNNGFVDVYLVEIL